jgi:hypothetical protein
MDANATFYGPDDLVLVHVGGNDLQPCILTSWFAWWSDEAQREHARGYLRKLVQDLEDVVHTLCEEGPFRTLVISEPPFSKYLPLAGLVSQASLQRLRQETLKIFSERFESGLWQARGCRVLVFHEFLHLDKMADAEGLKDYVDAMHPSESIHRRLGEILYTQIINASSSEKDQLDNVKAQLRFEV